MLMGPEYSEAKAMADFNIRKAVQAAAVLLKSRPDRRMNYYHLLKLLYVADRESLKETGFPVIGDRVVAMDNGPLHSTIYDFIKAGRVRSLDWERHIAKDGYFIALAEDPGTDELCPYEVEKLQQIAASPIGQDKNLARKETHGYQEYKAHYKQGTSNTIPLRDILEATGRTPQQARAVAKRLAAYDRSERVLKRGK